MAILITLQGPNPGQQFPLEGKRVLIGRQTDSHICLESPAVSRQHAQILCKNDAFYVEDVGSSNGTYLNGSRVEGRMPLTENDTLQIGPYFLALRPTPTPTFVENDPIIRAQVNALSSNHSLYAQNPAYKLQVVLEIAQHLGRTLDIDVLLGKLLDHLFRLFPQADRGMVVLCEEDRAAQAPNGVRSTADAKADKPTTRFVVRAQRTRRGGPVDDFPFSRTLVRRALDDGVGLLSEDVPDDQKLPKTATLISLNLSSFLCVPLICQNGKRLGVLQLDCCRPGMAFRSEDLEVLTAIGLQVAVVLENAALHAEVVREQKLLQELAVAREIQQSFLPQNFRPIKNAHFELFARVQPAREVSGDLYDFFPLADRRLAFFVGDVSGKGMPAALFMIAVRTLTRHLASSVSTPAEMLNLLNKALVADNPTALFVTLAHGIYDSTTGEVALASGGHPAPLLRRVDGEVEEVAIQPSLMLGYTDIDLKLKEARLQLHAGETLVLYTDGLVEAFAPDGKTMFEKERLKAALGGPRKDLSLEECDEQVRATVARFVGNLDLQDDQTLFLLRRQ